MTRWGKNAFVAVLALLLMEQAAGAQNTTVSEGRISGTRDGADVSVFWGVPFAAAPTGERRWAKPVPPQKWGDAVRAADIMPASCPQGLTPEGFMMWTVEYMTPAEPGISEDCLVANIWTPQKLDGAGN